MRLELPCTLAVHAAKRWGAGHDEDDFNEMCVQEHFADALRDLGYRDTTPGSRRIAVEAIPRGAVVGLVHVAACQRTENLIAAGNPMLTVQERAFGDYQACRWAWICSSAGRFEYPVACSGNRMIWQWKAPDEDFAVIRAVIAEFQSRLRSVVNPNQGDLFSNMENRP